MDEKRLEFRGGRAMALVPFVLFIVVTISLSFANFQDIDAMVTAGVIALLIGMIFCKSRGTITTGVAGMFNVSILLMLISCLTGRAPAWLAESATSRAAASGRWNMCSTTWPPRSPA